MHQVIFHDQKKCTEYTLGKNAHLTLFDIAIDTTSNPSPIRGGELPLLGGGHRGGSSTVKIILNGVGAEVEVYGLFFGVGPPAGEAGEESFKIAHEIIHQAPHTKSRILTRGALGGRAKASYNGNIRILKAVPGCDGRQEMRTLLLSREAHIDAVPHLEIGNNDVACAHSVSVSYIDEVKRFYCEARGLSEEEAIKAIVRGHFSAVLDKIQDEEFRMQVECSISVKLNRN